MNHSFDKSSGSVQHKELLEGFLDQGQTGDGFNVNNGASDTSTLRQPGQKKSTQGTFGLQFRAIMKKNLTLQRKNTGTNICQLLTPIVALAIVYLVKIGLNTNIPDLFSYNLSFPYIYNVPYNYIYDKWGFFLHDSPIYLHFGDCHQFYLYDFDKEASYQTKSFVPTTGECCKIDFYQE